MREMGGGGGPTAMDGRLASVHQRKRRCRTVMAETHRVSLDMRAFLQANAATAANTFVAVNVGGKCGSS